jgi:hypothetical protein
MMAAGGLIRLAIPLALVLATFPAEGSEVIAALAYGVCTLLALCASVPVWRAMGLL